MSGQLIVIDGPSCVGKSSLARALQELLRPSVWLNFSIDTVIYTLPASVLERCNHHNDWSDVDAGALLHGAFSCVECLLATGSDVIFDVVISTERRAKELLEHLHEHAVYHVGLTAEWESLEHRARLRQDRTLEEVKHGSLTSPKHLPYNLVLDTTHLDPTSSAQHVLESMRQSGFLVTPQPIA